MPKRIQRKRTKGWKMPPNTVYVGRPTKWGNVTKVGDKHYFDVGDRYEYRACTAAEAVYFFRNHATVLGDSAAMEELRGKDLACWCPLDCSCHADVLLEIANAEGKDNKRDARE